MNGTCNNSVRKAVKHGIGRLTASANTLTRLTKKENPQFTCLTRVAHKAPTRLIPIKKTSVHEAGAAVCALSNYGAGMLQGDSTELSVHVEPRAKLGVVTQGAARIYTQRIPGECKASMDARVEKDGVLVYAPDPCTIFASSSYSQIQELIIHPGSSIALVDWISSGRFKNQERWEFDKIKLRTTLKWIDEEEREVGKLERDIDRDSAEDVTNNEIPFLQDSISIDMSSNRRHWNHIDQYDPHAVEEYNCFASLIVYGEHMELVKNECQLLSDLFAAQHARIRQRDQEDQIHNKYQVTKHVSDFHLSGRVMMSVSKIALTGKPNDAYVFRCVGKTNEDIYRIFHQCLKPLAEIFGFEFYKDRIMAQRSEISVRNPQKEGKTTEAAKDIELPQKPGKADFVPTASLNSSASFWSTIMLADSGLPTGSFAHSAGLEVAAQLSIMRGEEDVCMFVEAATKSSIQQLAPFLVAGFRVFQDSNDGRQCPKIKRDQWEKLQKQCHAIMVTNQTACSASIDQGKSLTRVASKWLSGAKESSISCNIDMTIVKHLESGSLTHIAPVLGAVGKILGLDEIEVCRLFAYCIARDLVSSAVRLSLIGPLASIPMLHNVQESAENGICDVYHEIQNHPNDPLSVSATCAPVIEAIHPCHEILQVRLFRS